jgi:hypothetical protein
MDNEWASKLNEEIRTTELALLDRQREANEMKRNLELLKLAIKSNLDSKDKAFSNDDKREAYANEQGDVKNLNTLLQVFLYTTQVMEIELRFKIRQFEVMLK